ncbi:MAG: hypothetical protein ACOCX0_00435 [Bacteroidota bacterium]
MKKKAFLWGLAILITLSGVYYTRLTGPTKPVRGSVALDDDLISYRLIRSYAGPEDAPVKILVENDNITGSYLYKRTPSNDSWTEADLVREDDYLVAYIPQQPPAGKVMYQLTLEKDDERVKLTEDPIVIRFRGEVPAWAMIPHILLMFLALLFSTRAGLAGIFRERTFALTLWTLVLIGVGGLVFGPIVQKFAFGDWWTGWPFGTDLTDNKTAVMFILWTLAAVMVFRNKYHRTWVIVAAVMLLLIYLIPHSMMGSEIDFTQETTIQ